MLPSRVTRVVETLLSADGKLEPDLRRALVEGSSVPAPLAAWCDKVTHQAWRCSDEDVAALKAAGYSEDQILEATLAAALGASLARFELGLSLLK